MWSKLETYLFPLPVDMECPAGTFSFQISSQNMEWSEGLFEIHGLRPGEVVPTFELFMAHKHSDDRERVQSIWADLAESGGQGALLHRIRDIRGRERRVFSAIQAVAGPSGRVEEIRGFMVDVTQSLHIESQDTALDAIERVYAHRDLIQQAKGIVMALRGINGPKAFEVLAALSQHSNVKVYRVAELLVEAAAKGEAAEYLAGLNPST